MPDSIQARHAQWVRSVVAEFERPLLLYAVRLTGDAERAQDVVQETFLRLCTHERAQVEGHIAEWLFSVARTRALDARRKEKRMSPSEIHTETTACEAPSPPELAERSESTERILDLLQNLPENQQEVIRLKFQQGLSYKEISAVTRLSVTNVGFLIHTGLKTLRRRMSSALETEGVRGQG